jgi:hypothetical protein
MNHRYLRPIFMVSFSILLASCTLAVKNLLPSIETPVEPSSTAMRPLDTSLPPINTAITPTYSRMPSDTPQPTPTAFPPSPTPTIIPPSATPTSMTVKIFLIAMEDNGVSGPAVGCGDSAVAVDVQVPYSQGTLRAAMEKLLSIHEQYYGGSGLYNALYQSNLTVADVAIESGGHAVVRLNGTISSGGVCDDPRIIAQLERTALQFSTVHSVSVYVHGALLEDLLSGHG